LNRLKNILRDTLHLFYPHQCKGCGTDLLAHSDHICLTCLLELPSTGFAPLANNPVEKYFWGRIPFQAAHSEFYFSKGTLIQQLIHQLKYKGDTSLGQFLGSLMGSSLKQSGRFNSLDAIIPLPPFADRERKRGYNQSAILAEGISQQLQVPVITGNVIRQYATETQTRKHRNERWENVHQSFQVKFPDQLKNLQLLLVDDVVTTGATLEACAQTIIRNSAASISIAVLAHAGK
jgi:ComF family protein